MTALRLLVFICLAFPGHLFAQLSFDLFYGPSKSSKHPEQIISDGKGHFYMVVQQYSSNNTYAQLLYSGDGGIHWTDRTTEKGWYYFVGRNGMLYGIQNQSLYRSADLGATWALVTATMAVTLNSQLSAGIDGVLNLTGNEGFYPSAAINHARRPVLGDCAER